MTLPLWVGTKRTATVQLEPAATLLPLEQVVLGVKIANWPVIEAPLITRAAGLVPELVTVTERTGLIVPTLRVPKLSEAGEMVGKEGPTCGRRGGGGRRGGSGRAAWRWARG